MAYQIGPGWAADAWLPDVWADEAWGATDPTPPPTPIVQTGWNSADLYDRFLMYLGRGNGGVMQYDELWTEARVYNLLADGQEAVFAELRPYVPFAFVLPPVQLTTTDGGVTYDFPSYPFGHVEVYTNLTGLVSLRNASFGDRCGDFVFEGQKLRSTGNRKRVYASGPWARYSRDPLRISATVEPELMPPPKRDMILYHALWKAADVFGAQLDGSEWRTKYDNAKQRAMVDWRLQNGAPQRGQVDRSDFWWSDLSRNNR